LPVNDLNDKSFRANMKQYLKERHLQSGRHQECRTLVAESRQKGGPYREI